MGLYERYASGEQDKEFFERKKLVPIQENETILFFPYIKYYGPSNKYALEKINRNINDWKSVSSNAVYFEGYDDLFFDEFVIMVYADPSTSRLCTISFTKFGVSVFENLRLDNRSRFWPSCENLPSQHKKSEVRKALAITLLKNYSQISHNLKPNKLIKRWDETCAGYLAGSMTLIVNQTPKYIGSSLLEQGFLQRHMVSSALIDAVYEEKDSEGRDLMERNNMLACLLGDQLEQLFDPLLEYSPQLIEKSYQEPEHPTKLQLGSDDIAKKVLKELLDVQRSYTLRLINILQNLIIPLRVLVLYSNRSRGISKINQIFPPTIDEITRINCVLLESLSKAFPYGYLEVMRALKTIIPYFYKPYIRHETNMKEYSHRLKKFCKTNGTDFFDNKAINKKKFSLREIDSIMCESLVHLPKMKLIVNRLHHVLKSEMSKQMNFESLDKNEFSLLQEYYSSVIEVVDAFGHHDPLDSVNDEEDVKGRVFTPAGKILSEIALNWPSDLYSGWISRKVVGIFEIRALQPLRSEQFETEVLFIFSDRLLFINIIDEAYYQKKVGSNKSNELSVSDILMHSLVNGKPLPKLSLLPAMEVLFWADLNDVLVSSYQSMSSHTLEPGFFLSFTSRSKNGFRSNCIENVFNRNYEVSSDRGGSTTGNEIAELIIKAKILHKAKPFHLFKSTKSIFNLYSAVSKRESYDEERGKSPVLLLMNKSVDDPSLIFKKYDNVSLLIVACVLENYQIRTIAYSRDGSTSNDKTIPAKEVRRQIVKVITNFLEMTGSNDADFSSKVYSTFKMKIRDLIDHKNMKEESEQATIPKFIEDKHSSVNGIDESTEPTQRQVTTIHNEHNSELANKIDIKPSSKSLGLLKRKSFVGKIRDSMRHSLDNFDIFSNTTHSSSRRKSKARSMNSKASVSREDNTTSNADMTDNTQQYQDQHGHITGEHSEFEVSDTADVSTVATTNSILVHSDFQFPRKNGLVESGPFSPTIALIGSDEEESYNKIVNPRLLDKEIMKIPSEQEGDVWKSIETEQRDKQIFMKRVNSMDSDSNWTEVREENIDPKCHGNGAKINFTRQKPNEIVSAGVSKIHQTQKGNSDSQSSTQNLPDLNAGLYEFHNRGFRETVDVDRSQTRSVLTGIANLQGERTSPQVRLDLQGSESKNWKTDTTSNFSMVRLNSCSSEEEFYSIRDAPSINSSRSELYDSLDSEKTIYEEKEKQNSQVSSLDMHTCLAEQKEGKLSSRNSSEMDGNYSVISVWSND
ncbi:Piso0_001579 [Millerozyma farinosa CBS 7064]|uniref:Piso0_001579 protein n=1 Tax=Pichia sorbitophila (strain ATCC MYA-4447 / BCRC 22081 / CBS 7064 / NBRC 10061 / NRRL Y-12695) TaxID=559304 RepID=G8YNJ3_PICSO|nr:Piso0_001579 [Millerozyma farinosa CBS 7064]